jgi:folate-binding Fe-S cluster repair protein YgfZ
MAGVMYIQSNKGALMTKQEQMQAFVRHYRREKGKSAVTMAEVAAEAIKMGWKPPAPITAEERLAKQFAAAEREEMSVDEKTKRPYRANLSYTQQNGRGEQIWLWVDTDQATRFEVDAWKTKYREQMIGEAVIGSDTVEHWNSKNPDELPVQFSLDFTDEAEWRRNTPVEVEEEELV